MNLSTATSATNYQRIAETVHIPETEVILLTLTYLNNIAQKAASWYQTNLNIIKHHVLNNPLFGIYFLRKVVMLIMDEQIKQKPVNTEIPMELIKIYDLVERHLKKATPLKLRLRYYATFSTMLYTYIKKYLGKGRAYLIFEQARLTVLYDEHLVVSFKAITHVPGRINNYIKNLNSHNPPQ